jgi:hypothetical protein
MAALTMDANGLLYAPPSPSAAVTPHRLFNERNFPIFRGAWISPARSVGRPGFGLSDSVLSATVHQAFQRLFV